MKLDVQLDDEVRWTTTNRRFIISSTDYRVKSERTFDSWVEGEGRVFDWQFEYVLESCDLKGKL